MSWRAAGYVKGRVKHPKSCFVYLMKNERNGYFKIGYPVNPIYREMTLQAEEPEISLVLCAPGKQSHEDELHARFHKQRLRGEWFKLNNQQIIEVFWFFIELMAIGESQRTGEEADVILKRLRAKNEIPVEAQT